MVAVISVWVFPVSLVIAGQQPVTPEEIVGELPPSDPLITESEPWLVATSCVVALAMSILVLRRRLWVLPPGVGPSWAARFEVMLGAWIAMLLSTMIGAFIAIQIFQPSTDLGLQGVGMLGSYLLQIAILVVVVADQWRNRGRSPRTTSPVGLSRAVLWGLFGFVVALPVSQSLGMLAGLLQSFFSDAETPVLAHDTLVAISRDPWAGWSVTISILVILVTPCLEEFAYRGLLQQGFRKLGSGRLSAILLTSLMFVFMHVPNLDSGSMVEPLVALLSLSLILGWLYERTGRLLTPILVHALFNASNLLLMSLTL